MRAVVAGYGLVFAARRTVGRPRERGTAAVLVPGLEDDWEEEAVDERRGLEKEDRGGKDS